MRQGVFLQRNYTVHLPVWVPVDGFSIGVPVGSKLAPLHQHPAGTKPILVWGSSIAQGVETADRFSPVEADTVHCFKLKTTVLPRQARDKHRESTQKRVLFYYRSRWRRVECWRDLAGQRWAHPQGAAAELRLLWLLPDAAAGS
jgi:hypothetical protein